MKDYEFNIYGVEKYAEICRKFAKDTVDWDTLKTGHFTLKKRLVCLWKKK